VRDVTEGKWTRQQAWLVAGTALAIVADGLDIQLLGNALPSLMREWNLPRTAFSTALAMGPLGMMVGGGLGGWLGDRIGRRSALLVSVLTFGALTVVTAGASSVAALSLLRFLTGLGLGGALPVGAALASEYVTPRQRPFAVTVTIVCVPLGGMLAAFLAARIIPAFGWRALFVACGLIPVLVSAVLFKLLPESPRYLTGRDDRPGRLVSALFALGLRRDTLGLFGAFFFCLLANYLGFLLLVPTLTGAGFTQPEASDLLGWWNIGGVGGALIGGLVIQRIGSRITMLGLSAIAVASAALLAATPLNVHRARRHVERGPDNDLRTRGERVPNGDPRDRHRHGAGRRPDWQRPGGLCRQRRARPGRHAGLLRDVCHGDVVRLRLARHRAAPHSEPRISQR
jgi:AAHS family 4-hydroxybenzoate transporter-like MFS transporter